MKLWNADLHLHSPHSIAVSQKLNLDTMVETSRKKGLDILSTGDILQPEWMKYMEQNLSKEEGGVFSFKDVSFILQTEIEDEESIHHVVLFPNFSSAREVQKNLKSYSKNIMDEWGGRPRVNLSPAEIVDVVTDSGALIGPAHAFTPFKAIFRQGRFKTLEECYQDASKKVYFLELGLSANTELADRLESLKNVSFLSNSDAHSQTPRSLGREFNKFLLDSPSFEEITQALRRKNGRRVELNVGLHPKLGKYYKMFCRKCRRRIMFKKSKKEISMPFSQYSITENFIIYFSNKTESSMNEYISNVAEKKIICPACKEETGNNHKIKLGVSERIATISTYAHPKHPDHRPKYINAIPLIDIIRALKGIKSTNSKTVNKAYNEIIQTLGQEFHILIDLPIEEIANYDKGIADIIQAFRNDEIEYTPGGGGTYGNIKLDV